MLETAENLRRQYCIPREEQDKLAFESHMKATQALKEGWLDDLVVPCAGVFRDKGLEQAVSRAP